MNTIPKKVLLNSNLNLMTSYNNYGSRNSCKLLEASPPSVIMCSPNLLVYHKLLLNTKLNQFALMCVQKLLKYFGNH